MNSLCLVRALKPRKYNSRFDYSLITDEYPILYFIPNINENTEYVFSWFNYDPTPDHWCDNMIHYIFDGHTYVQVCEYDHVPTSCPFPQLPPIQGPPPPDKVTWTYPGYPTYSKFN